MNCTTTKVWNEIHLLLHVSHIICHKPVKRCILILAKRHHQLSQTLLMGGSRDPLCSEELLCVGQGSKLVQQLQWRFSKDHLLVTIVTGLFGRHQYSLLTVWGGAWVHNPDWSCHL